MIALDCDLLRFLRNLTGMNFILLHDRGSLQSCVPVFLCPRLIAARGEVGKGEGGGRRDAAAAAPNLNFRSLLMRGVSALLCGRYFINDICIRRVVKK